MDALMLLSCFVHLPGLQIIGCKYARLACMYTEFLESSWLTYYSECNIESIHRHILNAFCVIWIFILVFCWVHVQALNDGAVILFSTFAVLLWSSYLNIQRKLTFSTRLAISAAKYDWIFDRWGNTMHSCTLRFQLGQKVLTGWACLY